MGLLEVKQPKPIGNIQQLFLLTETRKIGYFKLI